jgi:hypothetical protein
LREASTQTFDRHQAGKIHGIVAVRKKIKKSPLTEFFLGVNGDSFIFLFYT